MLAWGAWVGDSIQSLDRQSTSALLSALILLLLPWCVGPDNACLFRVNKSLVSDHHPGLEFIRFRFPQICRVAPMDLEMLLGTAQLISHRFSIGSLPWTLDALIPPPWSWAILGSFGRLLLGLPRIPVLWNPARFPRY